MLGLRRIVARLGGEKGPVFVCELVLFQFVFFFSSRRRHTRYIGDWSSDVCSSDLFAIRRRAPERGAGWQSDLEKIALVVSNGVARLDKRFPLAANQHLVASFGDVGRSEERRVGKECRSRWSRDQ